MSLCVRAVVFGFLGMSMIACSSSEGDKKRPCFRGVNQGSCGPQVSSISTWSKTFSTEYSVKKSDVKVVRDYTILYRFFTGDEGPMVWRAIVVLRRSEVDDSEFLGFYESGPVRSIDHEKFQVIWENSSCKSLYQKITPDGELPQDFEYGGDSKKSSRTSDIEPTKKGLESKSVDDEIHYVRNGSSIKLNFQKIEKKEKSGLNFLGEMVGEIIGEAISEGVSLNLETLFSFGNPRAYLSSVNDEDLNAISEQAFEDLSGKVTWGCFRPGHGFSSLNR